MLKTNLKNFPDTALIGFAPNPEVAKQFDDWKENLELELKAKMIEYKPEKKASTKETWARVWCRLLISEILGDE